MRIHILAIVTLLLAGSLAGCELIYPFDRARVDAGNVPPGMDASDRSTEAVDAVDITPSDACPKGRCGPDCTDVTIDVHHCGSCDNDCSALPGVVADAVRCVAGVCDLTGACLPRRAHCSSDPSTGCETDISTPSHCGNCTTACAEPAPFCASVGVMSRCVNNCPTGYPVRCDMMCVNTATDASHCGDCATVCSAPAHGGPSCTAGACSFYCNPGYHACGSRCVSDLDLATCGASCSPCPAPASATATCLAGACGFSCNAGTHACGGVCVSDTDPTHCGAACVSCPVPVSGTATCSAGACGFSCQPGFVACGSQCVDLSNDVHHCGTCSADCTLLPNVVPGDTRCIGGSCRLTGACLPGFAHCTADPGTGCETNLSQPTHCGSCSTVCAGATPVCQSVSGSFVCTGS